MNDSPYPTANEIAIALVAGARASGEYEKLRVGEQTPRARWYAFASLTQKFPRVEYRKIARWCGFTTASGIDMSQSFLRSNVRLGKWKWWRSEALLATHFALDAAIAATEGRPAPEPPEPRDQRAGALVPSATAKAIASFVKTRRPADPALARGASLDMNYRPDPPIHTRNVDILTPELCGDPPPQRSALWARQHATLPPEESEPDDIRAESRGRGDFARKADRRPH